MAAVIVWMVTLLLLTDLGESSMGNITKILEQSFNATSAEYDLVTDGRLEMFCDVSGVIAGQQDSISSLMNDIFILTSDISYLTRLNNELQSNLSARTSQIEKLQEFIHEQHTNILELRESNEELRLNISDLIECIDDSTQVEHFTGDCGDIYEAGFRTDGPYVTRLSTCFRTVSTVLCEGMSTGRPWTVIHQRGAGDTYFYRPYLEYKSGFGTVTDCTDFWLGLEAIHQMTSCGGYQLRVEMEDWMGDTGYAEYDEFTVGDEEGGYKLSVSGYRGIAGDSLAYHNGCRFSTYDNDQDDHVTINCAEERRGAWWFRNCFDSHLNGEYFTPPAASGDHADWRGIIWFQWRENHSLKKVSMKIQRYP